MKLSALLTPLALSAAAVEARRSLQHVGPVMDRLGQSMRTPAEPRGPAREEPAAAKRADSGFQFLSNKTQSE